MATQHTYRYLHESSYSPRAGLGLATAGGRSDHPFFFRGFVERADQAARALLAVSEVARTRYFDAGALQRMRDPVVTSNTSVIRFESFSACNGVYARFDLDAAGFDAEYLDWGTTNVDVNEPLRAALTGVAAGDPLRFSVGDDELQVETMDDAIVERKVPLPARWMKGFAEVQIASACMMPVAQLERPAARSALQDLSSRRTGNRPAWVSFGRSGARLSQRPDGETVSIVGPQRLAAFRRMLPHVRRLSVYAPVNGAGAGPPNRLRPSAWVAELDAARLTVVVSPELYRGFSGEGAVLHALVAVDDVAVGAVTALLGGQARLDPEELASRAASSPGKVLDALQVLGAAGRTGHDIAADGFFHRDLPYDRTVLEAMQPRLQGAASLVSEGRVGLVGDDVRVDSDGTTYTVRCAEDGWRCTCAWYAKHRGERGPCKHVLAAQLARAQETNTA